VQIKDFLSVLQLEEGQGFSAESPAGKLHNQATQTKAPYDSFRQRHEN
jgi:hypothetical protein